MVHFGALQGFPPDGETGNTLDNGWQMHINSLGWRLYNDLIQGGLQPHYFDDLLKRAGDRDRLHVRFNIEGTELLNVPFESIRDPDVDDGYFRIKGPVVCKVARDAERNVDDMIARGQPAAFSIWCSSRRRLKVS